MTRTRRGGGSHERDEVLEVRAHRIRREILRELGGTGGATLETLVSELVESVGCHAEVVASGGGPDALAVELHHFHLPKIDALGALDYDPDAKTVVETPGTADASEALDGGGDWQSARRE